MTQGPSVNTQHEPPMHVPEPKYVYHIHGHARCHPPHPAEPYNIPFEVVSDLDEPIVDDAVMGKYREKLRRNLGDELAKIDPLQPKVGDVMIRGVSFLHKTIDGQVA